MAVEGKIIDLLDPSSAITFLYFEDITNGGGEAVYEDTPVRGRSEEHVFYSHTTGDIFNFNIRLVASVDEKDDNTAEKIWNNYLFIKSFQFPDHGDGGLGPVHPPRRVIITIGNWFRKQGLIKNPNGTFLKPYDENGFPMIIDVSFTLRVINKQALDYKAYRRGIFGTTPGVRKVG